MNEKFLIVGERINSSRKSINSAIKSKNKQFILKEVEIQIEKGANFIDVNAACSMENESEDLLWLVETIQDKFEIPLCLDSPNSQAIEKAIAVHKGEALINSITCQKLKIEGILPLVKKYNSKIIALTLTEEGMPETTQERAEITEKIIKTVGEYGIDKDRLYIDLLVRPVSSESHQAEEVLNAISLVKEKFGVKVILGISNVSFGLPKRSLLNATFLSLAISKGLDAGLIDPTDKLIISTLKATDALLDKDQYCMNYINAFRNKELTNRD